MSTYMYGIRNCDTIKKARKFLDESGVDYHFHDVRKDGLPPEKLDSWLEAVGWETLLNKRGTTWRQLPEEQKNSVDATSAREIMLQNPAIIKRPVLETASGVLVGFKPADYEKAFS
ncbi:MAG: ArsC family reductase [Ketobacteraceae bacterium]|nr:ArsC family reductase [Ketobacteraceae bacterium]